jgi:hypothetical protein
MKVKDIDRDFYEQLVAYAKVAQETENPILPLFFHLDGTLHRENTLAGPAFCGFTEV